MYYNLKELLRKSNSTIVDTLKGRCATCRFFDYNDINGEKQGARCYHHFDQPFDESCPKYDRTYLSDSAIVEGLERIERKSRYIVTAVCELLGLPEDSQYSVLFARVYEDLIGTKDGEQLISDYEKYGIEVAQRLRPRSYYNEINSKYYDEIHKLEEEKRKLNRHSIAMEALNHIDNEDSEENLAIKANLKRISEIDVELQKYQETIESDYTAKNQELLCLAKETIIPEFDKMVKDIDNNKQNRAVLRYIVLIRKLMKEFGIEYIPTKPKFEETNYFLF